MAWIVKLPPSPPPQDPLARALSRRNHPALPPTSIPPRPKRSASNARSNGESTSHTPTNSHPTTLDAVRRVRHHDLVAQLGRTRRTPPECGCAHRRSTSGPMSSPRSSQSLVHVEAHAISCRQPSANPPRRSRNVRGVKTETGESCRSVRSRSPETSASACAATASAMRCYASLAMSTWRRSL